MGKKILSLLLMFTMVLSINVSVDAAEVTSFNKPSELFLDLCNRFFEDTESYQVLDSNGINISEIFYNTYYADYLNMDIEKICNAFKDNDYQFSWSKMDNDSISSRILMDYNLTQYFYNLVKAPNGASADFVFSVSGSYRSSDATQQIIGYQQPVFNIVQFSGGGYLSYSITNISTNAYTSSSATRVTFSASCKVNLTYMDLSGSHISTSSYSGTYTANSLGKIVSRYPAN